MLADIIFKDKAALAYVNNVIHPAVGLDFSDWCSQHESEPYIMNEAALHFESGVYKEMDRMITVFAPENLRIKRVMLRDKLTQEQIKSRIDHQLPDEEKMKRSDYVIYNDGHQGILEQVIKLHQIFINL
jgi:dephospho-CoA kinase